MYHTGNYKVIDYSQYRHSMALAARHASTLFYLDHEGIQSLKWANVSYSINKELGDLEGQAVSMIKQSVAWSLLGGYNKALELSAEAEVILNAYLPSQIWWILAANKVACLSQLRSFRQKSDPPEDELIDKTGGYVKAMEDKIKKYYKTLSSGYESSNKDSQRQRYLKGWEIEVEILKARQLLWKYISNHGQKQLNEAKEAWEKAWRSTKSCDNWRPDREGSVAHIATLCAALIRFMKREEKAYLWDETLSDDLECLLNDMNEPKILKLSTEDKKTQKWYHCAIMLCMKATQYLAESRLMSSQKWFLNEIIDIAEYDLSKSAKPDLFVNRAKLWASYYLVALERHTSTNKECRIKNMKTFATPCNAINHMTDSMAKLFDYFKMPVDFVTQDEIKAIENSVLLSKKACDMLHEIVTTFY